MSDKKISQLTAAATPLDGTEVLPIVQSGSTVKATVANIVGAGTSPGSFTTLAASGDVSASNGTVKSPVAMNLKVNDAGGTERTTITLASPIAGSTQGFTFTNGKSGATYPTMTATGGTINTQAIRFTDNFSQGTAAKGINFTANTPAAGMTSQLLNWYEEGTWTPTILGDSGSGVTYSSQIGRYVKVGKLVYVSFFIELTSKGTISGEARMGGLPFTVTNMVCLHAHRYQFRFGKIWQPLNRGLRCMLTETRKLHILLLVAVR